ncbi:MAG: carboxypeptidase-like regulatory domain-containing protein [Saprospiraceae bacterium]
MKRLIPFLLLILFSILTFAQTATQTIKGTVIDKVSQQPLIGATVSVEGFELLGTATDINGNFRLEDIPVGRRTLRCQYVGYETYVSDNIILNSAKELELNIALTESGITMEEVTVVSYTRPNEALNELSLVSTRSFSVEETQRYAASANDPSRMAMGFPGVQASRDSRSDIVIRGNSGIGLLWRLEGIDIPNPNHFARRGSSGGGITIFSVSMLSNSDFSTGAFPAEYGNAFSGVFDIKFRKGNRDKREHSFRAGMLGLDFSTEGPIKKGRSSYLINYRYSTLGLLNQMGIYLVNPRTDNVFQDLSFNLFFPSKNNKSIFTVWGMGGLSDEFQRTDGDDPSEWTKYTDYRRRDFQTDMGAVGVTHTWLRNDKSFVKTSAAAMGQKILFQNDTLNNAFTPGVVNDERYTNLRYSLSSYFSQKLGAKTTLKTGAFASLLQYDLQHSQLEQEGSTEQFINYLNEDANTLLLQPYVQFRFLLSPKWTVNAGGHFMFLTLNNTYSLEPRIATKYQVNKQSSLSLAYGLHGRMLPIGAYFTQVQQNGITTQPNKDLKMIKSHHLVLAYEFLFKNKMRLNAETYYQYLFDVPVGAAPNSTLSILNRIDGYGTETLINEGTGKNIGLDLTLEKFFNKGTFFLLGASVFNSTYTDASGEEHSTRYNSNFSGTLMGGKEWTFKNGSVLQTSLKLLSNGGSRITPLQEDAPVNRYVREAPFDESRPFEKKVSPFFRPDLRVSYRVNKPKVAWMLALDVQNVINRVNEDGLDRTYDPVTNTWEERNQSGLTPILSFQIDF